MKQISEESLEKHLRNNVESAVFQQISPEALKEGIAGMATSINAKGTNIGRGR
ncbi:MAG: hypothetical protein R3D71_04005 [Rickettsiales bacterium]